MTLQSVFEEDRERLLSCISKVDREMAVRELQSELDRILVTFNDLEKDETVQETVSAMMQTARSAVMLLDTEGTARIYERTPYGTDRKAQAANSAYIEERSVRDRRSFSRNFRVWLLPAVGILCMIWTVFSAAPLLGTEDGKSFLSVLLGILITAGTMFAAGKDLKTNSASGRGELYAETTVDPEKACRSLLSVILTMDQVVDTLRTSRKLQKRRELSTEGVQADPAELELMAQLLEDAYSRMDEEEQAQELCMQLKYYLHQKEIEVVDYEKRAGSLESAGEREALLHEAWFDMIPAYQPGTLRPALVRNGILLKKGLASNG